MSKSQSTLILRVRFAETDKIGIAHHSNYAVWLEAARIEWLRKQNISYREWDNAGVFLVLNYISINYRRATYFDDELSIDVKLIEARQRRICFSYTITRIGDELLIATGETAHTPSNPNGKAISLPKDWLNQLVHLVEKDNLFSPEKS